MADLIEVNNPAQVFQDLLKQDENLQKEQLEVVKKFEFLDSIPIVDPTKNLADIGIEHPMFVWPPQNGFRSLSRKGFYKIVSPITVQSEKSQPNYVSFWAKVLFCNSSNPECYYEYTANVGPLVNSYAVIYNLSPTRTKKLIKFPNRENYSNFMKEKVLIKLIGKAFYVSYQQIVEDRYKQTFWFRL